jgi:hypothetical protein
MGMKHEAGYQWESRKRNLWRVNDHDDQTKTYEMHERPRGPIRHFVSVWDSVQAAGRSQL